MKTTLLALVVALAACGAPATSTRLPAPVGATQTTSTTAKSAALHKTTSTAQSDALDPTNAGGSADSADDEVAAQNRIPVPLVEHGGLHPEAPHPASTGDPCGWCRSTR